MADDNRKGYLRLNHFHGLRLESEDFQVGERYHIDKRKLHNKYLHGYGVVQRMPGELQVKRRMGDMSVDVYPGYALDGEGNDLVLHDPVIVPIDPGKLPELPATCYIVLKYVQDPVDFVVNVANPRFKGHRRMHESVRVDIDTKVPNPEDGVELARIRLTDDVKQISDARDPTAPAPGEIDMRYRPLAGCAGTSMASHLMYLLRDLLGVLRKALGSLGRAGIHSSRDVRAAVMTLDLMVQTGNIGPHQVVAGVRLILELADEMRHDVDVNLPEMNTVREWEEWKELVEGLLGVSREAKPLDSDIENLLKRFDGATNKLLVAAEAASKVEPPKVKVIEAEPEATPDAKNQAATSDPSGGDDASKGFSPGSVWTNTETGAEYTCENAMEGSAVWNMTKAPKPKEGPAADEKELSWEELQKSSVLPEKLYMDGQSYVLVDTISLGDRASEASHDFAIEGAKQDWTANQSFKYPDGGTATSRGRAHVGGTSKWKIKNLTPGKELLIAKRIDFARGDIVARIEIEGKDVGNWEIRGSDRRARWRNWLFRVPGDFVNKADVNCAQVAVEAERDINMYGLWFYAAT